MEHETSPPSNTPAVQSAQMAAMRRAEQDGGSNSFLEPSMMNGVNSDNFSAHYLAHPSSIDTAYAELSGQGHIAQNQQHSRSLHPTLSFGATHVDTHGTPNPAAAPFSNGSTSIHADNVPPFRFNEEDFGSVAVDPNLLNFPNNGLHALSDSTHGHHYDNNVVPLASNSIQSDGQQTLPTLSRHQSSSPHSNSVSGFATSNIQIDSFPRNREASTSLDPSSALFGNNDWAQLNSYRGHHRTASDNISEYSAHSNQASPYIGNLDVFETSQVSPLLGAAQDPSFNTDLGLQQFTLNDTHHSPAHSPGHSPHISPQQQSLPLFAAENMFGVTNPNMDTHFSQHKQNHDMFPAINSEAFPTFGQHSPGEFGAADQMSPPEINIDYAPPSGVPVEHDRMPKIADDTLSPPHGYLGRGRERAKSDSFAGSRSSTPGFSGRGRLPSLQSEERRDKLSPFHNQSRSPSPGRGRAGSLGNRARSSSAASDHRDYILDLAIPERSPSNGGDSKRVQKHPATFQCTLCPKRFTRAYNLRSHLRTHTDERPFVCTVCGKAFARQHDRKRHEGLHSGEKKFVCRGLLQNNSSWGCGRRFARADALGRHFRSEAGRVCIKPLLDEEIAEKRKQMAEDQLQTHFTPGITVQQSMMDSSPIDVMSTFLPAAILQQYPALANIDWSAMQSVPHPDDNYGGRTSFDASSGGDYDLSENEASDYADTNSMNMNMIEGMGLNINGQDTHQQIQHNALRGPADYLGDFDGR